VRVRGRRLLFIFRSHSTGEEENSREKHSPCCYRSVLCLKALSVGSHWLSRTSASSGWAFSAFCFAFQLTFVISSATIQLNFYLPLITIFPEEKSIHSISVHQPAWLHFLHADNLLNASPWTRLYRWPLALAVISRLASTCWLLSILGSLCGSFSAAFCLAYMRDKRENVYFMWISSSLTHQERKKGSVISFIDFPLRSLSLLIEPTFSLFHPIFNYGKFICDACHLWLAACYFWRLSVEASEQ
jgi:hypothetical protein